MILGALVSGAVISGLTVCSSIVTAGITLNATENYGNLTSSGSIVNGTVPISGTYGTALEAMSWVTLSLSFLYLVFMIWMWSRRDNQIKKEESMFRVAHVVIMMTVLFGITLSAMVLYEAYNFAALAGSSLTFAGGAVPAAGTQARGSYGIGLVAVGAITIAFGAMCILGYLGMWTGAIDGSGAGFGVNVLGVGVGAGVKSPRSPRRSPRKSPRKSKSPRRMAAFNFESL